MGLSVVLYYSTVNRCESGQSCWGGSYHIPNPALISGRPQKEAFRAFYDELGRESSRHCGGTIPARAIPAQCTNMGVGCTLRRRDGALCSRSPQRTAGALVREHASGPQGRNPDWLAAQGACQFSEAQWYVFPHGEGQGPTVGKNRASVKADPTKPMSTWRTAWRRLTRVINSPDCGLLQDPALPAETSNAELISAKLRALPLPFASTICATRRSLSLRSRVPANKPS
jgi:hypothetical protein